jgi:RNA polymerase sigma-70 factor (ECF subfamily)
MEGRLSAAELTQAADPLVIVLACAGDDKAFAEVVRRRQGRARKFMYHLCRDRALGDDLAQQVFLIVWRSLGQLRAAAAFDAWLKRIMITTWLEELRRDRLKLADAVEPEELAGLRGATAERLDLDSALGRLPAPARLCVVLAHNEGMTHPEIAAATGLPLGTVKSHIVRGAARLREFLAAYKGELVND